MILEVQISVDANGVRTVSADSPLLKGTLTLPGSQAVEGQLCHLQVQLIQGRVAEGTRHPADLQAEKDAAAKAAAGKAAADAKAASDKAAADAAQVQALEATAEAAAKEAVDKVLHPAAQAATAETAAH